MTDVFIKNCNAPLFFFLIDIKAPSIFFGAHISMLKIKKILAFRFNIHKTCNWIIIKLSSLIICILIIGGSRLLLLFVFGRLIRRRSLPHSYHALQAFLNSSKPKWLQINCIIHHWLFIIWLFFCLFLWINPILIFVSYSFQKHWRGRQILIHLFFQSLSSPMDVITQFIIIWLIFGFFLLNIRLL